MDTYHGDCPESGVQKLEPAKLQMSVKTRQPKVSNVEQQQGTRTYLNKQTYRQTFNE